MVTEDSKPIQGVFVMGRGFYGGFGGGYSKLSCMEASSRGEHT